MIKRFQRMDLTTSDYARHVLPIHPHDGAGGLCVGYRAIAPVGDHPPASCGFARCQQNYFEQRFFLGDHRIVGFHGGLN